MPEQAAAEFHRSVQDLDKVVRRLGIYIVLVGAAVLVAIVVGIIGIWALRTNQIDSCRDSNTRFDQLLTVVAPAPGSARDTPEARAVLAEMRRVSVIDCDQDGDPVDDISHDPNPQE